MEVYTRISAMEPLLPTQRRAELSALSAELLRKVGRLSGQVHSPVVRGKLAVLLRWMNCYYSNLIEGYKTEPLAIERALRADYSDDPVKRDNQKLSQAHIEVEALMVEGQLLQCSGTRRSIPAGRPRRAGQSDGPWTGGFLRVLPQDHDRPSGLYEWTARPAQSADADRTLLSI